MTIRATNNTTITGSPVVNNLFTPAVYLPKTGDTLTTCTIPNSDCITQIGLAWPNPRYTAYANDAYSSDNCVTDNVTDLVWVKNYTTVPSTI